MARTFSPTKRKAKGRTFNGNRGSDILYDRNWQAYREKYLEHNPRCYACGATATVVDHLIPHKGDKYLFTKTDNHIPLCKFCHDKVTALFDSKFKIGSSNKDKIEWLQWTRASKSISFRIKVMPHYP